MTSGIVRRGDRVRRPTGSWSPAVHEYLRHLESAGFEAAPRVLGVEHDREVLTYIEGDVAVDPQWQPGRGHRLPSYARTDSVLCDVARLLRQLHTAAAGFEPTCVEYRFHPHPPRAGELVSHGDLGPWNTVYRDGAAVAFIDWDTAQPVDPLTDLAAAAWAFVPLVPASRLREAGFDPVPELPYRLRLFVDAYGLAHRREILPALRHAKLAAVEHVKYWPVNAAETAAALRHTAGELQWLHGVSADLARAL